MQDQALAALGKLLALLDKILTGQVLCMHVRAWALWPWTSPFGASVSYPVKWA